MAVVAGSNCGLANFQAELMQRINAYRARGASCGSYGSFAPTTALTWNDPLQSAAARHSKDMASKNFFSHTGSDGSSAGTRITQAGYSWRTWGENIAAGQTSVQQVVDGWMASPGHCANLMKPAFRHVGVACVSNSASTYRMYWTMDLAAPL
ncbi:CAP domain-containing protein [Azohydromonas sp. G-1-1-14]|uniref:CAP domain-containing protein n=2 Tax=Azohydromonas caseinilytica TaxID=2728836 RepID=A0A848FE31_9BURK|nr:CAP domain-containing protein [Azohydromonas caseinilytica]